MITTVNRNIDSCHPLLQESIQKIQTLIRKHNLPFCLFETERSHERQEWLLKTGKMKFPNSGHMCNLDNSPPLYTTTVAFVCKQDGRWSWNLRDSTTQAWYKLFGNLVLDVCPELAWGGLDRHNQDYTSFQLRSQIIYSSLDTFPCVLP